MTEYPHDQFDDVPEYRDRRGGHRAAAEPSGGSGPSGLTWISVAAALALVVGAFSYFILPTLLAGGTPGSGAAGAAASARPTATPQASASPGPTKTPKPTGASEPSATPEATKKPAAPKTPAPSKTPAPTPSTEETEEPATVDYSFPVEVYNASRVGGLAGRVGGTLSGSGFTVVTTDNWAGFRVDSSAVYYSSNEATAQAVAARLGLPAVYNGRIPGIAVVVTAAYAG